MAEDWTQEEAEEYRQQKAAEMWDGADPPETDTAEEEAEQVEQVEDDPWAGVPAALRMSIEGLSAKVSVLDEIGQRLKVSEGRIGSIQSELQRQKNAAVEAAKQVDVAPTKEQMAAAARSTQKWEELKEEFPEWAEVLEDTKVSLKKEIDELRTIIPRNEQRDVAGEVDQKIQQLQENYERKLLTIKHPDWREKVALPEYGAWLQKQSAEIQRKALESKDALECIEVLDAFEAARPKKKPAEIVAERKQRLEASTERQGGQRPLKQKNVADMSEEEYRRMKAKEIWG
jgi:hypothetical protein